MNEFYQRQLKAYGMTPENQKKIEKSRVLIIGAGGLGNPCALYLAGAGVGHISILDFDTVSISNLHRQIAFTANDIGKFKSDVLANRLRELNPYIEVHSLNFTLKESHAKGLISQYDLVVDGTDNFTTKFLIHSACFETKTKLIQGSISAWEGIIHYFDFMDDQSPCLGCLYPKRPEEGCVQNCAEAGVMGPTAGVFGSMMASVALKTLIGMKNSTQGVSYTFDLLSFKSQQFKFNKNLLCPQCGTGFEDKLDHPYELNEISDEFELVDLRVNPHFIPVPSKKFLLFCHRGVTSLNYVSMLRDQGHQNVWSLKGGASSLT
jgi:molybdopterin/thiamine biosynthesis adenylyltransferase